MTRVRPPLNEGARTLRRPRLISGRELQRQAKATVIKGIQQLIPVCDRGERRQVEQEIDLAAGAETQPAG